MPKSIFSPSPSIFRNHDEIYVLLPTTGHGQITVRRPKNDSVKPVWTAQRKAVISWSGGNGSQTIEEAQQFGRCLVWATQIARALNARNPSKLTDDDILHFHRP